MRDPRLGCPLCRQGRWPGGHLAVQLHVQAERRQALAQHGLGMLLADHEDWPVGWRKSNGIGCQVDLAHEFVVLAIVAPGHQGFGIGEEGFEDVQVIEDFLGA